MSKGKKITLTVLSLVLLVLLGREIGICDFQLASWKSKEKWSGTTSHRGGSVSIANVKEAGDGATIHFSDGSSATLKVDRIVYSGTYFLPLFKHIVVDMVAFVTSSDGRIRGHYTVNSSVDITGTCSILFARKLARMNCINVILYQLSKGR